MTLLFFELLFEGGDNSRSGAQAAAAVVTLNKSASRIKKGGYNVP